MRRLNIFIILFISFACLHVSTKSFASMTDPLTTIELETPVHFLAPDGSDILVEAGTYAIEPAEEWIRLMSGARHDAVLIEATKGMHEMELEQMMGLSVPGETEEEKDLHHVMLLLPEGQSLDATGTYSGIRHRGFLKNTFNRVKKKANRAYKKARSTAKKTVSKAKSTVSKAKKRVQQSAKKGISKAKKGVQNVRKGARQVAKKAGSTVRKGYRTARDAALHAKRQVEKSARKVTRRVRQGVKKVKGAVSGILAPPPSEITLPNGPFFNLFAHNQHGHAYINSYLLGFASLFVYEPDLVPCRMGKDCWSEWKRGFRDLFSKGGMTAFQFIKEPVTNTQAAVMSNSRVVIVVFRGSEKNAQDWLQIDAAFPLIPALNWGKGVMTHTGFTAAFRSVFPRIRDAVRAQNRNGSKRVWLTGHSLGGAMAFLHAHALVREARIPVQGVHTYGAPRVGNTVWNRVYTSTLGTKTQRWVNNADFVPLIAHPVGNKPYQILRYQHVGHTNNIYADQQIKLQDNERSFPPTKYSAGDHNLFGYLCPIHKKLSHSQRNGVPSLPGCNNR